MSAFFSVSMSVALTQVNISVFTIIAMLHCSPYVCKTGRLPFFQECGEL